MAKKKVGPVLFHILEAIDGIQSSVATKTIEDYQQDWLLRHGTQRALEIISEASRRIPEELLVHAPEIPWKKIKGIGNVLRHESQDIADDIIWEVLVEMMEPLKSAVDRIKLHMPPE